MTAKTIAHVIETPPPHWVGDGFLVRPLFDNFAFRNEISPFLMLDYAAPVEFPPSERPPGVGAHPHKGFETVTIVYHGEVEHRDSAGNSGRIGPGDVQWMTAGSGLLHDEFHAREAARRGGVVSMAQLWVNLPRRDKNTPPRYQTILDATIPAVPLGEGAGEVRVIAGSFGGARGPAQTFSPVDVWDITLAAGGEVQLDVPDGHNGIVNVLHGTVVTGGQTVEASRSVLFSRNGAGISIRALADSRLLVLAGAPLDEPIAHYGPFVMNTQDEIRQAIDEFRRGKMGDL